MKAANLT